MSETPAYGEERYGPEWAEHHAVLMRRDWPNYDERIAVQLSAIFHLWEIERAWEREHPGV